jgi:hypothetical protein
MRIKKRYVDAVRAEKLTMMKPGRRAEKANETCRVGILGSLNAPAQSAVSSGLMAQSPLKTGIRPG